MVFCAVFFRKLFAVFSAKGTISSVRGTLHRAKSLQKNVFLCELCKNTNKNLKLIFLPPYSPNLNPIEKYWATLKKNLKKITKNNKSLEESIYEVF